MIQEKPTVTANNAHFLKGHASWLYCDQCNRTVAYLCYVTYRYFSFRFHCRCGGQGSVVNQFGAVDLQTLPVDILKRSTTNKRFCCARDDAALFSPVPKNLNSYHAEVVCKECNTRYTMEETF